MFVVTDASAIIGVCAREAAKLPLVEAALQKYERDCWLLYAPHLVVMEALYVFCGKLKNGLLTAAEHSAAIANLQTIMTTISPPLNGDASLIARAEAIRGEYGCSHSADSVYLALSEELATLGATELLTFDEGQAKQAAELLPQISVNLLVP